MSRDNSVSIKRFLVVDDHFIVRTGTRILIQNAFPNAVIDEAENQKEVIQLLELNRYTMMITDLNMPNSDAFSFLPFALRIDNRIKIIVLTVESEGFFLRRLMRLGVLGYVNKTDSEASLLEAISICLTGDIYISKSVEKLLMSSFLNPNQIGPFDNLSNREIQIASLLIKGYSITEIANLLSLAKTSVATYKTTLFEKLEIANQKNNMALFFALCKKHRFGV